MTKRIAIVTDEDAPELTASGDRLRAALERRGYEAEPVVWTDSDPDGAFDAAVLRSCWNYYRRPGAFLSWLDAAESTGAVALNPRSVVEWNVHKSYLLDLAAAGVPVVPTEVVGRDEDRTLESVLRDRGWEEAVVKPAVGTSAAGVWRTSLETAAEDQRRFDRRLPAARKVGSSASPTADEGRLSERDSLVQQFVPAVAEGERSIVFFGGEYSHGWRGVRATDALGVDAAVDAQDDDDPPESAVAAATDVLAAAGDVLDLDPGRLPYARVDGVVHGGVFRLMELELVEPYLRLERNGGAADRFAAAVESELRRGRVDLDR